MLALFIRSTSLFAVITMATSSAKPTTVTLSGISISKNLSYGLFNRDRQSMDLCGMPLVIFTDFLEFSNSKVCIFRKIRRNYRTKAFVNLSTPQLDENKLTKTESVKGNVVM